MKIHKKKLKKKLIDDRFSSTFVNNFIEHLIFNNFFSRLIFNEFNQFIFIVHLTCVTNLNSITNIISSSFLFAHFLFYNIVICYFFSTHENTHSIYVDFDFEFTFIFESCRQRCYSNQSIYFMSNNKKFKCTNIDMSSIIFIKCTNVVIRLQSSKKKYVKIVTQIHILFQLQCDMILNVSTLKSNDMIISWFSNLLHVKNQIVSIKINFDTTSKTKKKYRSSFVLNIKFSIFSLIRRRIKKNIRHVVVYVNKIVIFQFDQNINISIRHRFLSTKKIIFSSSSLKSN